MTDPIFSSVNLVAMLGWVLLAALPQQRWAQIVCRWLVPTLLATVYVAIIATHWLGSSGGFASLAGVAQLFADPWLLLAGWVHYLAFDLLVGCWIVRDARQRGIAHLLVVPSLALTFLFGPAGWLSYVGLRAALRARAPLETRGRTHDHSGQGSSG
jgi:hypothetical protein